jgi:hypothetical protein
MLTSLIADDVNPGTAWVYPISHSVQGSLKDCFVPRVVVCPGQQVQKLLPVIDDERDGQAIHKAFADAPIFEEYVPG